MMRVSSNCILKVVKLLYGVPEAGNHWFATYHNYHINDFAMTELTYDPCLLYRCAPFDFVGLQTDDTLMLANDTFAATEEEAIKTAKFITKERAYLSLETLIKFNGTWIQLASSGDITLSQETRDGGISLIKEHEASTTGSRELVQTNLSPREQSKLSELEEHMSLLSANWKYHLISLMPPSQ